MTGIQHRICNGVIFFAFLTLGIRCIQHIVQVEMLSNSIRKGKNVFVNSTIANTSVGNIDILRNNTFLSVYPQQ